LALARCDETSPSNAETSSRCAAIVLSVYRDVVSEQRDVVSECRKYQSEHADVVSERRGVVSEPRAVESELVDVQSEHADVVSEQRDVVSVRQAGSLAPASGRVGASRERLRAPRRRLLERSRAIVETRRRVGAPSRRLVARKGRQGASCDVSVVASRRLAAPSGSPGVRGRRRRASTERPVAPRRARGTCTGSELRRARGRGRGRTVRLPVHVADVLDHALKQSPRSRALPVARICALQPLGGVGEEVSHRDVLKRGVRGRMCREDLRGNSRRRGVSCSVALRTGRRPGRASPSLHRWWRSRPRWRARAAAPRRLRPLGSMRPFRPPRQSMRTESREASRRTEPAHPRSVE